MRRYDIQGKRYLASNDKYHLSDHAFKYAKLGTKNADHGRMLENFVAIRRDEKLCIQVANSMDDPDAFRREVDPLLRIRDAYPRIILARTRQEAYQHEGVKIEDVADWLLELPATTI